MTDRLKKAEARQLRSDEEAAVKRLRDGEEVLDAQECCADCDDDGNWCADCLSRLRAFLATPARETKHIAPCLGDPVCVCAASNAPAEPQEERYTTLRSGAEKCLATHEDIGCSCDGCAALRASLRKTAHPRAETEGGE